MLKARLPIRLVHVRPMSGLPYRIRAPLAVFNTKPVSVVVSAVSIQFFGQTWQAEPLSTKITAPVSSMVTLMTSRPLPDPQGPVVVGPADQRQEGSSDG